MPECSLNSSTKDGNMIVRNERVLSPFIKNVAEKSRISVHDLIMRLMLSINATAFLSNPNKVVIFGTSCYLFAKPSQN